jgi:hypothetical protein
LYSLLWKFFNEVKINRKNEYNERFYGEIESIENGVMKWKALRQNEDGTTFTSTFEMTKVTE